MVAGFPVLCFHFWLKSVEDGYMEGGIDKILFGGRRVAAGGPFGRLGRKCLFEAFHPFTKERLRDFSDVLWWSHKLSKYLLTSITKLLLCGYAFARAYLIIECFIQLVHLPPGPTSSRPASSKPTSNRQPRADQPSSRLNLEQTTSSRPTLKQLNLEQTTSSRLTLKQTKPRTDNRADLLRADKPRSNQTSSRLNHEQITEQTIFTMIHRGLIRLQQNASDSASMDLIRRGHGVALLC
ncbi:hypothetical protein BDZ45DRAFT_746944 [Acephala macrosclerotiorum]|nr:hypothetical protein BDZ45DRAFT_746944 [Acephala macrosclerotiorum]